MGSAWEECTYDEYVDCRTEGGVVMVSNDYNVIYYRKKRKIVKVPGELTFHKDGWSVSDDIEDLVATQFEEIGVSVNDRTFVPCDKDGNPIDLYYKEV